MYNKNQKVWMIFFYYYFRNPSVFNWLFWLGHILRQLKINNQMQYVMYVYHSFPCVSYSTARCPQSWIFFFCLDKNKYLNKIKITWMQSSCLQAWLHKDTVKDALTHSNSYPSHNEAVQPHSCSPDLSIWHSITCCDGAKPSAYLNIIRPL